MMRSWRYLLSMLVGLLALSGCVRRDLLDPELAAELRIRLLTDGVHNVTCDIYNPELPRPALTSDKLRALIYNASGEKLLSQGFLSHKSYDAAGNEVLSDAISLTSGDYRIVGYNFDVDRTQIEHESKYSTIRAIGTEIPRSYYTRFGTRTTKSEAIFFPPEHLLVAREEALHVANHTGVKRIELDARTVVETYYLQIRISGLEHIASNALPVGSLSGMSPWYYLGENRYEETISTSLYFELQPSTDPRIEEENQDVICALINTFGRIPESESELSVTFSVLTRDGETHQKVVDMRPIFESQAAREHNWLLIDEVWEIPAPIFPDDSGNGGFNPEVDDWEDIEEVIPIGPRT